MSVEPASKFPEMVVCNHDTGEQAWAIGGIITSTLIGLVLIAVIVLECSKL